MTENKRFRRFYNYLIENETNKKYDIQDCCNLLNNLSNENEQLRLQLNSCSDQRNEFHRGARENANRVGKLKKENEQLKSENQELKSNVIDLIDKKINKLKNINEVSIIPRESVEILKELKKELQE